MYSGGYIVLSDKFTKDLFDYLLGHYVDGEESPRYPGTYRYFSEVTSTWKVCIFDVLVSNTERLVGIATPFNYGGANSLAMQLNFLGQSLYLALSVTEDDKFIAQRIAGG